MSGSPMANSKSGPDYAAFITKYLFSHTPKMSLHTLGVRVHQVEDHCTKQWNSHSR
jgi:hypothetical protein